LSTFTSLIGAEDGGFSMLTIGKTSIIGAFANEIKFLVYTQTFINKKLSLLTLTTLSE